jgi:uncharacterized repeat protein (TIGR03803 family)
MPPITSDPAGKVLELSTSTGTKRTLIQRVLEPTGRIALAILFLTGGLAAQSQTLYVYHNFGAIPDGQTPQAGLMRDRAGNLFGTTEYGGELGKGTVFEITSVGVESVLHSFGAAGDGVNPVAALAEDAEGNLYGTTLYGGTGKCTLGCGTIFKMTPAGEETVLHNFSANIGSDGNSPAAGVVLDGAGNLYGTTQEGGWGSCHGGCGTVYEVSGAGVGKILWNFEGGTLGGWHPEGGLVMDTAGNLYGTTSSGGGGTGNGCGLAFKLSYNGTKWVESVLHRFLESSSDGCEPVAALTLDSAGNLYGTTALGGTNNYGTVFKISPAGKETVLVNFDGTNGRLPLSALVQDADGNFYGTTSFGPDAGCGGLGCGTVFQINPQGQENVYFAFPDNEQDGEHPLGVILDAAGNLYGTTPVTMGNQHPGNVFQIAP